MARDFKPDRPVAMDHILNDSFQVTGVITIISTDAMFIAEFRVVVLAFPILSQQANLHQHRIEIR
jgi:hypothetical protein